MNQTSPDPDHFASEPDIDLTGALLDQAAIDATPPDVLPPDVTPRAPQAANQSLTSVGFLSLMVTQFLGAFNDNLFRWLAVPIGQQSLILGEVGALVLGGVCFTLPYLFLAPLAGSLADRFPKRTVIVGCKVAEILLMLLGVLAICTGSLTMLFAIVTLMGAQSALFAPAKFGTLPELFDSKRLSTANGLLNMVTVIATALGTVGGYQLFGVIRSVVLKDPSSNSSQGIVAASLGDILPAAFALVGIAVFGTLASLFLRRVPAAAPESRIRLDPITETVPALRLLFGNPHLGRTTLGIAFFWLLASLAQMNIDPFGERTLGMEKDQIGILMAVLVAGMAFGSVLAGYWSGGHVELGIVPLGAIGIVFSAITLYGASHLVDPALSPLTQFGFYLCCAALFLLGTSAGLFDVPLEANLQYRSSPETRGTILAGANFVAFSAILFSCGLFFLLSQVLHLSSAGIFLVAGLLTIPVAWYIFRRLPAAFLRFIAWMLTHTLYRVRILGESRIPEHGGALIVANHVSFVDGMLMLVSSSRFVRFLVYADYTEKPVLAWISRTMGIIPIKATSGPRAIIEALNTAKEAIKNGEVVCIFPEGAITRTGQMQAFNRGFLKVIDGTDAPVIPANIHGLWGSIFSFHGGKFFWKRPRVFPYPVTVAFGEPMHDPKDVHSVRSEVERLGTEAELMDKQQRLIPVRQFIRQCKSSKRRLKIADSSGLELTGGRLLTASLAMRRTLRRTAISEGEKNVGVLLPPAGGAALANLALALDQRVAVNLNYTLSDDVLNHCVKAAGIKHVLTSRKFLEKKPVALEGAEWIYLEDIKEQMSLVDKACSLVGTYMLPAGLLDRLLGLHKVDVDDTLTIIFTSGSTGEPKGVVLSHANIASNIAAVDQLLALTADDCLMGVLPFFHSFGYAICLWLVMSFDPKVVYHYNPLDAKMIGKLAEKYRMTILLATPTFLRMYLRRCEPEQFKSLDMVVVGAEKLPIDLGEEFQKKFNVFPTEGYGTTELSPVAAANVPDHRSHGTHQVGTKPGTVGRPLPGVSAKIVDPDTFAERGQNVEGLLLIKGANVMRGYLDQPEKTAEVIRDGWYVTGDFAKIDADGFITITGRMSRFSKIGGEMVPHIRIEEELLRLTADSECDDDDAMIRLVVTAVPDPAKGERLVVLHRPLSCSVEEALRRLSEAGLPNLWLPSKDSFREVPDIPLLGTGKLDLRAVKQLALDLFA
ncbi:MAG: acyl-[ACP]--phospholipid O-acyltransferase [Planctomycetaceae bacterium]